jgi:hypothetical protein
VPFALVAFSSPLLSLLCHPSDISWLLLSLFPFATSTIRRTDTRREWDRGQMLQTHTKVCAEKGRSQSLRQEAGQVERERGTQRKKKKRIRYPTKWRHKVVQQHLFDKLRTLAAYNTVDTWLYCSWNSNCRASRWP